MPTISKNAPYDPSNRESLENYASKLVDKTLGEALESVGRRDYTHHGGKGAFGQILEGGYFMIGTNSAPVPDFEELGIELKVAPMKRTRKKSYRSKERMVIGVIDYEKMLLEGFERTVLNKANDMLVVFYLDDGESDVMDKKILGYKFWKFSDNDLKVLKNDWNILAKKVENGRAHEISGGDTWYLEAAPKGSKAGSEMRKQPYSPILAQQRAFSLKSRYVQSMWGDLNSAESLFNGSVSFNESAPFEERILSRFKQYEGREYEDLRVMFGLPYSPNDKARFARLAKGILGIDEKRDVEEFEKAGIKMKTMRLEPNGTPKESMSFPYFKFEDLLSEVSWNESEFHNTIDVKFLFVIFQITTDGGLYFRTAKFWNMPSEDLNTAGGEWDLARSRISSGELENILKSSEGHVIHVRPHAANKGDTYIGSDGKSYEKKCFWIDQKYLKQIAKKLCDDNDKSG
ncbi:MAG: hypothetical protein LBT41_04530 [Candidatus Methanoplasma sp.]|nr:hypothetical protein [Candidatus Methanoplasma sp.]